jgi:hypothetical protein
MVVEIMNPFFASLSPDEIYGEIIEDEDDDSESSLFRGITPILIACDRGNLACLLYFCNLLEKEAKNHVPREKESTGTAITASRGNNPGLFWEALIGSPLKSRTVPDGMISFHHCTTRNAALAERSTRDGEACLDLLERISLAQESLSGDRSNENIVLALGESVNAHDDTPLMLAASDAFLISKANDSVTISLARGFLERWHKMALRHTEKESDERLRNEQIKRIYEVLRTKNDSQRTILNYLWTTGIVDAVEWLIDVDRESLKHGMPIISSEETAEFRRSIDILDQTLSLKMNIPGISETGFQDRRDLIEKCSLLLEAYMVERSELMARRLLEELDDDNGSHQRPGNSKTKPTKSKKKRMKKRQQQQQQQQRPKHQPSKEEGSGAIKEVSSVAEEELSRKGEQSDVKHSVVDESNEELTSNSNAGGGAITSKKIDNAFYLTKLANGRMAVNVPGQPEQEAQEQLLRKDEDIPILPSIGNLRKRTMSLDETNRLLRDRYRQGSSKAPQPLQSSLAAQQPHGGLEIVSVATPSFATQNPSSDADSVLSALCLDVNCLLYSDHGMALNLSPAQLDAVERILKEQLQSVAKARVLQERRWRGGASNAAAEAALSPSDGTGR